jgi:hypothetical protein
LLLRGECAFAEPEKDLRLSEAVRDLNSPRAEERAESLDCPQRIGYTACAVLPSGEKGV